MSKCPECNGTGQYVGLNKVEPCKACSELRPLPEQFGKTYHPVGYFEHVEAIYVTNSAGERLSVGATVLRSEQ